MSSAAWLAGVAARIAAAVCVDGDREIGVGRCAGGPIDVHIEAVFAALSLLLAGLRGGVGLTDAPPCGGGLGGSPAVLTDRGGRVGHAEEDVHSDVRARDGFHEAREVAGFNTDDIGLSGRGHGAGACEDERHDERSALEKHGCSPSSKTAFVGLMTLRAGILVRLARNGLCAACYLIFFSHMERSVRKLSPSGKSAEDSAPQPWLPDS